MNILNFVFDGIIISFGFGCLYKKYCVWFLGVEGIDKEIEGGFDRVLDFGCFGVGMYLLLFLLFLVIIWIFCFFVV